jgi:hypothetical protein
VPVTSTNWPATKWPAVISCPTSSRRVGLTRNSPTLRFGSTFALAKWPRIGLVTFFGLALPAPSCTAVVAVLLGVGADRHDLAVLDLSTVTGTCCRRPRRPGHAHLLCDQTRSASISASELDLDVDAGGEVELHQRVHRLRRRVDDVEEPLVRPDLELLAALLVDVRPRSTVNLSIRVGSGIGPRTCAPVRFAVLTISRVDWSSTR